MKKIDFMQTYKNLDGSDVMVPKEEGSKEMETLTFRAIVVQVLRTASDKPNGEEMIRREDLVEKIYHSVGPCELKDDETKKIRDLAEKHELPGVFYVPLYKALT